jgi:hypothetical protein
MDYDLIVERSRESTLQNWIATVHDEDVIRLVAKYRPGQPECTIESVLGGSFNVCFKVAFADGLRWIVRVPKPGRVMFMEKKVRDEVAVMKYIKSTTSIPVPDIIAFGTGEDNVGGFGPLMITEFIFGDNLGVKLFDSNSDQDFEESIYRQIAGFLLQLSNCRFDTIGSLSMDSHGDEPTWSVRTRPLTLAINEFLRGGGVNLYGKSSNIILPCQVSNLKIDVRSLEALYIDVSILPQNCGAKVGPPTPTAKLDRRSRRRNQEVKAPPTL